MLLRTPADSAAVICDRRKQRKLGHAALAKRIGVSRQWLIEMKRCQVRAEVASLRGLDALSIRLDATMIDQAGAHLLPLSMPLAAKEHGHSVIESCLWLLA
jgi:transcriptional regulator with XRE-family HTH domain